MKKLNENPIDQYFREMLESPDLKFNKQDWKGFKKMLPEKSKQKGFAWWYPASVAAAILLLFASLWLWDDRVESTDQLSKGPKEQQQTLPPEEIPLAGKNNQSRERTDLKVPGNDIYTPNKAGQKASLSDKNPQRNSAKEWLTNEPFSLSANVKQLLRTQKPDYDFSPLPLKSLEVLQAERNPLFYNQPLSGITIPAEPAVKKTESDIRPDLPLNGRISLALSFSPDINSVNNFSQGSFGTSFGLGANYRLSSRLVVSTAIAYSKKEYSAKPDEYKASWVNSAAAKYAESIDADCRVLDVPINLTYNFMKSPRRNLFASAGVSSYFMMKEKYTLNVPYNPAYPNYSDPTYTYKNRNTHLLSVINLSAGIEKPLNKQTSLVIAPYARLPLTGIGQGKVDLQSAGLNLQIHYNLKKKERKPISVSVAQ